MPYVYGMVAGTISRVRLPFEGSISDISMSTNSVFSIDSLICARSGMIMERAMRGRFGAPLSKIGTLLGKLILFLPSLSSSFMKPLS